MCAPERQPGRTSQRALIKMCDLVDGQYRIRPSYPVIVRFPVERYPNVLEELRRAVERYLQTLEADRREVLRRYYFEDFARNSKDMAPADFGAAYLKFVTHVQADLGATGIGPHRQRAE